MFEVKWPIDAQTLAESMKVDEAMTKGYAQIARLRAELADGRATVEWPNSWEVDERSTIHWWVASAQQLDTRRTAVDRKCGSTSLRLVEHLFPRRSLADLHRALLDPPKPELGREYTLVDQTVRAGNFVLTAPALNLAYPLPVPPQDRRTNRGWT